MASKQQCGVGGCGNNAAPGKSYCVFHRNATAADAAAAAPQPAAAATTPPQLFRAPSHGSSNSGGSGGGSGDFSAAAPPKFRAPSAATTPVAAAAATPPPPPPPPAAAATAGPKVIPPPPPPPPAQSAAPVVPPPPPAQPQHAHASSTPTGLSKTVPPPPPPQQHQHSSSTAASLPVTAATPPAVPPRKASVTQPPPSQLRSSSGNGAGSDAPASATPTARTVPPPPPAAAASTASSSAAMSPHVKVSGPMITTVNVRSPPMLPPPSGSAGASGVSGPPSGLRTASASVSFTRLPPTSRFSLSNNSSSGANAPGSGTLDLSSLKQLVYSHCTHIPEVLSAQVDTGIYAVHRIIAVLKRTISAEESYWAQHIKTFEHESVKLERLSADGCERTHIAWTTFQQLQIEMAQRHLEGTAALTQHVLVPLLEFYSVAGARKKELDKEIAGKEKECHTTRIAMQKDLAQAEKLMETWKILKAQEEGVAGSAGAAAAGPNGQRPSLNAGESSSSGGGGGGGLFSKLSSKINSLSFSSSAAVVDKLAAASVKYSESLAASNRRAEIFMNHELPVYLHELQRLEVQRLELSAQALAHWTALASERSGTIHTLFFLEALPKTIAPLDPERDIDESLSALVALHGFAPTWSAVGYALPVSIEDIKAGRIRANPNSVFHVSLAQLMEQQAASPSSSASAPSIPKFLSFTLDAIRAANGGKGLESEGVFRISPSKDEMEAAKRGLDSIGAAALRKEDVVRACAGNVYLACALLKEWLRSLKEAVIPTGKDGYDRAMQITKKHVAATAALDSAAATNSASAEAAAATALLDLSSSLGSFYAALPAVNRAVLQTLACFAVDEVVKNHATNRMTVENLSIVFAPCLLRSASEDPMELLNNSKHEIRFIALLFKFLAAGAK